MLLLRPALGASVPLRVLCLGAHSDDIEIGCGATLLTLLGERPVHVTYVVFSATGARAEEARASAEGLLAAAHGREIVLGAFRDGFFPAQYEQVKDWLESLKTRAPFDLVLTHRLEDRHQDHRLVAELTWNTFRAQLVLEYEILKYEGDLGQPNVFVAASAATMRRKVEHLTRHFGSQRSKDWFSDESFLALARLRGVECRAPEGYAEAFHGRKLLLGW